MALIRVLRPFRYSSSQSRALSGHRPWSKNLWKLASLKPIRDRIRAHLFSVQSGKCCYCGVALKVTSSVRIDHVAPKSVHGEFTYEARNLVGACQFCNEELKKEQDTIAKKSAHYKRCVFSIVHPVFDDPALHISTPGYLVISLSPQGKASIKMFKLTNTRRIRARKAEEIEDKIHALPQAQRDLVLRSLGIT